LKASEILDAFGASPDEARGEGYRAFCPVHEQDGGHSPSLILDFTEEGKCLVHCQSRSCDYGAIVAAAGLSPRDLVKVSHIGQSTRRKASAPAPVAARVNAATGAYRAARALAEHLVEEPKGRVAAMLRDRFSIDPTTVTATVADALGIGLDPESLRLTVTARRADGAVAFVQGRASDPKDSLRWIGLPNPEGGRWDAAGFIGTVDRSRPVLIVEGPSDGLTVAALDAYDVVAVRGATQARRISEVETQLPDREVFIAADNDPAGRLFAETVAETLAVTVESVRIAHLPEGSDVGDFRSIDPATFGERFAALLADAVAYERPEPAFEYGQFVRPGAADYDLSRAVAAYAETIGHGIAWNPSHGYLYYDGRVWRERADLHVRRLAHRLGLRIRRDAGDRLAHGDSDGARELSKLATSFLSTSRIDRLLRELQAVPGVFREADEFDADPNVLAAANGLVNLRTGSIRPVRREDYITKRLDVDYNPDAKAPRFERFLTEVFVDANGAPDLELRDFMQALFGYGATGHTSEEIFVVLNGKGGNGKSKLLEAIGHVFGPHVTTTPFATFEAKTGGGGIPNDLAALKGARFVWAHEANGKRMEESTLKAVTGQDVISARFLHKEFFSYRPQFLLMLSANQLPSFFGQDDGLWRRVKLVHFRAQFRGKNAERDLSEKLAAEAEGILAWAVRGSMAWYANGRRLPACAAVELASSQYRQDSDPLGDFLGANVAKTGNRMDVVYYADLYTRYAEYAQDGGERATGSKKFGIMLDERIGPREGINGRTSWPAHVRGYRLLSPREMAERLAQVRREIEGDGGNVTSAEIEEALAQLPRIPVPATAAKHAGKRFGQALDLSGYAGADVDDVLTPGTGA
jgi:putative DNA primase/helicase